jgi:hypothetical protein
MTETITTFTGLTKNNLVVIFNEAKKEQERMTIGEFIRLFNSGIIDYSVLGYDATTQTMCFYPVTDVFLIETQKPVCYLFNTSFDMKIPVSKNKVITQPDPVVTKKINKVSPLDCMVIFNKNLEFSLETNWLKTEDFIVEDLYDLTIESGTCLIVNDVVITI